MTRRQVRHKKLTEKFFLPFEARQLNKVPFKVPYMRLGIKERIRAYNDSVEEYRERGLRFSKAEWKEIIMAMYIERGWLKDDKPDVWQMLRAWEDRYKAKHPEYSPDYGRKRKVKKKKEGEFRSKYAKGLQDYEKGRFR